MAITYLPPNTAHGYEASVNRQDFLSAVTAGQVGFEIRPGTTEIRFRISQHGAKNIAGMILNLYIDGAMGGHQQIAVDPYQPYSVLDISKKYQASFGKLNEFLLDGIVRIFSNFSAATKYLVVEFSPEMVEFWKSIGDGYSIGVSVEFVSQQTTPTTSTTSTTDTPSPNIPIEPIPEKDPLEPEPIISPLELSGNLASFDITSETDGTLLFTVPEKKKGIINIDACTRLAVGAELTFFVGPTATAENMVMGMQKLPYNTVDEFKRDVKKNYMNIGRLLLVAGDKVWVKVKKNTAVAETNTSTSPMDSINSMIPKVSGIPTLDVSTPARSILTHQPTVVPPTMTTVDNFA